MSYNPNEFGRGHVYWQCPKCERLNPKPMCLYVRCEDYLEDLSSDDELLVNTEY